MVSRLKMFLFVICAAVLPAFAEIPAQVAEFGRNFIKSVQIVQSTYATSTNGIPAKYVKDLAVLSDKFQQAGDLDGLLAVKGEQKRFGKASVSEGDPFEAVPEMPADAFVKAPAELRALQEGYVESFTKASKAKTLALKELGSKFSDFLEKLQREFTREGRIEEAISIRNHSEAISAFLKKNDFAGLVAAYPSFGTLAPVTVPASSQADQNPRRLVRDPNAGWRRWHHLANRPFSRDLPLLFDRDLPSDISADFISSTGRGRFVGVSRTVTRQVGSVLCSWFGNAILWKVDSPDDLSVSFFTRSRKLTTNLDHGPHIQLAVFLDGKREKLLNVPVYAANDVIRIVRDKKNPERFALYWPFGRQSETFELTGEEKSIVVMFGVSLHDQGESCDVALQLKDEAN